MGKVRIVDNAGNKLAVSQKAFDLVYKQKGFSLAPGQTGKVEEGAKAAASTKRATKAKAKKRAKKSAKKSAKATPVNKAGAGTETDKTDALTAET